MHNEQLIKICSLIISAADKKLLKKAILSKSLDKTIQKVALTHKVISKKNSLQAEFFHKDNKVTHKNFSIDELGADVLAEFCQDFMQINLITSVGECEYNCSASGKTVILNDKKLERAILDAKSDTSAPEQSNNRQKSHILSGNEPFLKLLGVSDENGRIYDKKQAKFRQINRFLEIIRDCEDKLPTDSIRICDLCCGKSYLSFAAYHYFAVVKGMKVRMTGVDLKPDVIEYCSKVSSELGFDGLEFICGDINDYVTDETPSLVISLHACDIATDIVMLKAAEP